MEAASFELKKRSLYKDEIRERLRDAILSGELKPGERLVETRWAKAMGVSQSPVREAIRELETMGLVESKPFQGSFVKKLTLKEVNDAYEVRTWLEILGTRRAVERITDEDLERVRGILKDMIRVADDDDFEAYIAANVTFHHEIMKISDNQLLIHFWEISHIQDWVNVGTKYSKLSLSELARRHEDIYEALAKRDASLISDVIADHLTGIMEDIARHEESQHEEIKSSQ